MKKVDKINFTAEVDKENLENNTLTAEYEETEEGND